MSEEQAAAAEPIPEGKEPITLRVRDQVSILYNICFLRGRENGVLSRARELDSGMRAESKSPRPPPWGAAGRIVDVTWHWFGLTTSSVWCVLVILTFMCFFSTLIVIASSMAPRRAVVCVTNVATNPKTGEETFFKIKKGTKMSKVFSAFAKRKGVQASSLRFLMDGDRVKEDDTPLSLELEDQDMLDCMLEQTGGSA